MDLGVLGWHQAWTLPIQFSSVSQSYWLFATWTAACQASLSITPTLGVYSNSRPLIRWCHPNISSSVVPFSSHLQSFPEEKVFSNGSLLCIRWPKFGSFSFSISPSGEYSTLISFRMDWFDLFAVQGTLKNLLQHCSSKGSILQCSAFFIVQLKYPYMTTIALTRQIFVCKVMSLILICCVGWSEFLFQGVSIF